MIIKFLANGTGDPKLAASYLIGEQDHLGNKRAGVEIVRGDPIVFTAIASSLKFQYCYTSVVIAWSPEDQISDEHLNEVLDLFEEHTFAGLGPEQYHMTAVQHADDEGSRHLHILIPRVELTTGKSLNVAPPGHRHYFDPLRDFLNQKYGWARPDDPARMKTTKPKNHHALQNAAAVKSGLQGQPKKTFVEMINAYIEQRIIYGVINNRDDLVQSLKEITEVCEIANKNISTKFKKSRARLKGEFYRAGFSFSAYRENRTRREGIQAVSAKPKNNSAEYSERLTELFERMEAVRRKRAEYNQKYYRTKVPQNEATIGQAAEISYAPRTTVSADFSRETDDRHRVNSLSNKNRDAVSRFDELNTKPAPSFEAIPKRDNSTITSNRTEQRSVPVRRQRIQEGYLSNEGITQTDEQSISEPRFEFGQVQQKNLGSTRRDSRSTREDAATIAQSYLGAWDVRCIKYPITNQTFHLNIGVTHERKTVTDLKKPTDLSIRGDNTKSRTTTENAGRGNSYTTECDSRPESLHQRTREIAEATARLSRTYAQRKLALEQEAQRYECEVNRERQDNQSLSRRNQERNFLERTHHFFGNIKEQIRNTFRKLIDQFTDTTTDRSESRTKFEALSQSIDSVGIDRLVNIARQRTQRKQRIENVKRFKQDLEHKKESAKQKLALNTMTAELSRIQENFPRLELRAALGVISTAECCFHEFRDANKSDEDMDLYIGEYVYSIDECFKSLGKKLNTMKLEELDALKGLATVIEGHLGQIQLEKIDDDSVIYYDHAKRGVGDLAVKFRNDLTQQEITLSNNILSVKGPNYSEYGNQNSEQSKMYGSDYDTFLN